MLIRSRRRGGYKLSRIEQIISYIVVGFALCVIVCSVALLIFVIFIPG